jgi:Cu-Zn family superoxide dismutase
MRIRHGLISIALAVLPVTAVGQSEPLATAQLIDREGREVGKVTFRETATNGLLVTVSLVAGGLPAGQHAFHIHEKGSCAPNFQAAGDHFNPEGHQHGVLAADGPHAGDLPNLHIPASGDYVVEMVASRLSLGGRKPGNLLDEDGSAVVIHAKPDDHKSQPSGDAGDRIACGVVQRAS